MLVLVDDPRTGFAAHRATVCQRLVARLLGVHLDRQLAGGISPDRSLMLALRARLVVDEGHRRMLASALERVIEESLSSERRTPAAVLPNQDAVRALEPELRALADQVRSRGPVPARGVCEVRLLLIDGAGPLFARQRAADLPTAVRHAMQALDPLSYW